MRTPNHKHCVVCYFEKKLYKYIFSLQIISIIMNIYNIKKALTVAINRGVHSI